MSLEARSKKRKHSVAPDDAHPAKKSKKTGKVKERKKKSDKGAVSEFRVINASLVVSIAPIFASSPRTGVEEMLDSMVMRYIPAFRGVVLAHSNLRFLDQVATINADCPFSICKVCFDATVWSPHVAMKLVGKVNLCSPDHISLLVHRTFNVSIPRYHIPTDEWEFEYGPAENDPEFGADAVGENNEKVDESEEKQEENGGRWVHRLTGERLGGPDGFLEFTVVGLTVANEMLSLLGSIQHDPFSEEHVPGNDQSTKEAERSEDEVAQLAVEGVENDDESDEDVFTHLGRMGDEAAEKEARRKAAEEEAARKEKKRKRKVAKELEVDSSRNKTKRKKK